MDDSAALRLTLRRCTAVVVVGLGLIAANTHPYGPDNSFGYFLAYLAVGYLALSLFAGLVRRSADSADSPRGPPSDGGGDSGDGADSDDGDGADESDADDPDRPPAATFGGGHW
ncbi:hypothetical protein C475_02266 [Halosimplex carlsbadense 2-9-1]|uniref:Uncharacterized protein n=1 Tax=Halosimplex carlsbadense 2-9-1 TaxID=797114 RepID=M0D6E2_9EURY|nr:hypothetical protein [Halosimplex carlsbadense]ELZ29734.1 hypothetical protein C475_02266 [Halosimplex carlsbadense 2-9-1]